MSRSTRPKREAILPPPPEEEDYKFDYSKIPSRPLDLCCYLKNYIVGQDSSIEDISAAVVAHYKVLEGFHNGLVSLKYKDDFKKDNILIFGPSGCGKTRIGQLIARYMGVPFVMADAASMSEPGYVGEDPENMIKELYREAGNNAKAAEQGIIYIDEIDKKRRVPGYSGKDVSGEGVQNSLLKIVEGRKISWEEGPMKQRITIDTSDILFIAGGAFSELAEVMVQRRKRSAGIGFGEKKYSLRELENSIPVLGDLIEYGMIEQFPTRFPVKTRLRKLTVDDLVNILKNSPDSATENMKTKFRSFGIEIYFDDEAYKMIAKEAINQDSAGARSLNDAVYDYLKGFLLKLPSTEKKELIVSRRLLEDPQGNLNKILEKYPIIEDKEAPDTPRYYYGK